ncbi:DEAD/DEAH box helicase [Nocardia macrotermitis]|uniref:ATP-dependent RNA helicase RhlB n=1 Tax=Nocardia macrotermitis TaxID=2585198 RepID=A0A7K0CV54_9NOCA|nr:DEAD/DEAH box helicase [Nocardia macrotermitis]MQY17263.1 ATP-dependent RNA helicase RhlB [Nocardia macrotermitis]
MNSTESASGAAATTSFAALGVPATLVGALRDAGIAAPFPIQADTLPDTLAGRDVLGRGRTGSGKTLAFAIPVVARLAGDLAGTARPHRPAGLILAPTRELATQIATALEPLVAAYSMTVTTVFGGVSQNRQVKALAAGADIVVACPGRLEDLMRQRLVDLGNVGITVIDEADHMADLGFLPGVTRILAATPADGQRLLFSATLDNGVDKLVKRFLPDAVLHSVDEAHSPVAAMTHHVFEVASPAVKKDVVRALASGSGRRILFMRTKHQARKLAKTLTAEGIPAVDLHGNLAQNARDRNLAAFAEGTARVLVATDVAARGVHVDGVELVVHVDPPAEHKAYLHRSGRTARAGSAGDVVTLVLPDQRKDTAALLRKAAITVRPQSVTASSREVGELVGVVAPVVVPSAAAPKSSAGTSTRTKRSGARIDSPARKGRAGEAVAPVRNGRGDKVGGAQSAAGRSANTDSDVDRSGFRRRDDSAQSSTGRSRSGGPRGRGSNGDSRAAGKGDASFGNGTRRGWDNSADRGAPGDPSRGGRADRGAGAEGGRSRRRDAADSVARQGNATSGRARNEFGRSEGGRGAGDRAGHAVRSDARESYSNGGHGGAAGRRGSASGDASRGGRGEDGHRGGAARNGRERSASQHAPSGGSDRSGAPARRPRQGQRNGGRDASGGFLPSGGGRRG